jgi:hypothetical protein
MKQTEMIALGLAGVALYMIVQITKKPTTAKKGGVYDYLGKSTFELQGGKAKNGWTYFDDGTALDPEGNAWQGGQVMATPGTTETTGGGLWT